MKKNAKWISSFLLLALVIVPFSCKEEVEKTKCRLVVNKKKVRKGQRIDFEFKSEPEHKNAIAKFYFDEQEIGLGSLEIGDFKLGKHRLQAKLLLEDSIICQAYKTIEVYSEIVPVKQEFKLVNTFPHQRTAYTQGLVWNKGKLYEGTGQYEESILAEVNVKTGQYNQKISLADEFFGEGVTVMNDKIYQLTWQSQKCFVYDLNDFELIEEFEFDAQEGWGLTNDGQYLIMSDGSHLLRFIDPETHTESKKIEVYSGRNRQAALNELEYIDGFIYANIYQKEEIAIIEPSTGKIVGFLDCTGLLDKKNVQGKIDVLNGIAYNTENKHIYLTGKWWPSLFEIKLNQISPTP